ncbi:hypothetical protein CY34DRAFT_110924 [Suillus luteus UH-Slu-Lm8-n1]|uniref:Helitron helicase-like domain-containing protein n=1 Tax=Suillus luteus UH-Slu-Lm8-n1 TaxID=930992 RepID=A0A0C9Z587_9AGAM|nr:hypothetical protein CY34DRAFT_110924 [Suillus luteus UH-Slu-Lm8-n1]
MSLESSLEMLSKKEIIRAVGAQNLNRAEKRNRSALMDFVQHSMDHHSRIISAAQNKAADVEPSQSSSSTQLETALHQLTVKEILQALHEFKMSRAEKRNRTTLLASVRHSAVLQSAVLTAAETKAARVRDDEEKQLKKVCLHQERDVSNQPSFLEDVGDSVRNECLSRFIDRTGNAACRSTICVVCAGEFLAMETTELALLSIQHKDVLKPYFMHHSQQLVDGMLLYNSAITTKDNCQYGYFCEKCLDDIKFRKTPALSLANNLWVGDIPEVLSMLTLPERILVALSYPAAYIVKLFPKKRGAVHWDTAGLNSGLRGNVSTYRLNTSAISAMVEGTLLPPKPSILATTIGVSIIGPNGFPERCLPSFLSVSRAHLRNALLFLKQENPLYNNINISEENLMLFPEHGIPDVITASVRHLHNVAAVDSEREDYVPEDDVQDIFYEQGTAFPTGKDTEEDITSHGILDSNVSDIDDEQILAHALSNMTEKYSIQRGSTFVNEYPRLSADKTFGIGDSDNPNHLLGAFPYLFPYAAGGFEVQRPRPISYEAHAQWAMRYADRRYRKDFQFMFQVFGVIQKRQVKKDEFHKNEYLFRSLTVTDLQQASEEEEQHKPCSNATIRHLKKHLTAVRSKVMGTDESRTKIRSLIWGMSVMNNPPSLWITINPTDTHDPIAQVFTGAEIDLDHFQHLAGPDSHTRSIRIAEDPFAAAKFFHFIVSAILEELFGIRASHTKAGIIRHPGIFGTVQGYIGTVEAQGRGTLHLHIILWLSHAPTASEIKDLLQTETFRTTVASFIAQNIHGYHPHVTADTLKTLPRQTAVSYSRPPDPRSPTFLTDKLQLTRDLVRAVQIHTCSSSCLKVVHGRVLCKRHAPFATADTAWIDSEGNWGPKRNFSMMNNWNSTILLAIRANHDIKLITNGEDTKDISFYISMYTAKNQQHSSNASALLAKSFAFQQAQNKRHSAVQEMNKHLIQRCANSLSREQEFSAPEVVSYLMKWDDRYISHHFEPIYFSSVINLLKKTWPQLASQRRNMLYYISKKRPNHYDSATRFENILNEEMLSNTSVTSTSFSTHMMLLSLTVIMIPLFAGKHMFASHTEQHLDEPWRSLADLKSAHVTFEHAFDAFTATAGVQVLKMIDNIQYFYNCSDKAREKQVNRLFDSAWTTASSESTQFEVEDDDATFNDLQGEDLDDEDSAAMVTELDIEVALQDNFSTRELLYADVAVNIAEDFSIFRDDPVHSAL